MVIDTLVGCVHTNWCEFCTFVTNEYPNWIFSTYCTWRLRCQGPSSWSSHLSTAFVKLVLCAQASPPASRKGDPTAKWNVCFHVKWMKSKFLSTAVKLRRILGWDSLIRSGIPPFKWIAKQGKIAQHSCEQIHRGSMKTLLNHAITLQINNLASSFVLISREIKGFS